MTVYFEDDITKFPYQLLDGTELDINGSKGNRNIIHLFDCVTEPTLFFVDVPVTAAPLVTLHNRIVRASRNYPDVYVAPIPCIEYYFIRAFIGYTTKEAEIALRFMNYRECTRNYRGRMLRSNRSYEKFCKPIVSQHRSCYNNNTFVSGDCTCDTGVNLNCGELALEAKRRKFLYSLPIISNDMNVNKVLDEQYTLIDTMITSYVDNGVLKDPPPILRK